MKVKWLILLALLVAGVVCCSVAWAGEAEEDNLWQEMLANKFWQGKLADGTVIGEKGLEEIIRQHGLWLASGGEKGEMAFFGELSPNFGPGSMFRKEERRRADLHGVKLRLVDLSRSNFDAADLRWSDLRSSELCAANLMGANLHGSILSGADLHGANLYQANLSEAKLWWTDLSMTDLTGAKLSMTDLSSPKLGRFKEMGQFFPVISLNKKVNSSNTNLRGAIFEPDTSTPLDDNGRPNGKPWWPELSGFASTDYLWQLVYIDNPQPLTVLRDKLKQDGFLPAAHQLTHALRHNKGGVGIDSHVAYYFIAWPTQWGLNPMRPILFMFLLILPFYFFYWTALYRSDSAGIWMIWNTDSLRRPPHQPMKQLLKFENGVSEFYAIYFSVLSAFHIGLKGLDVGNWITRMQPREYTLRATGWVRVVSGIQSLISVYLLALAVLTYFGRPFD
ncbi:MAG: pentapeptide repeat-containing protein [Pseudomonadota bacterium]